MSEKEKNGCLSKKDGQWIVVDGVRLKESVSKPLLRNLHMDDNFFDELAEKLQMDDRKKDGYSVQECQALLLAEGCLTTEEAPNGIPDMVLMLHDRNGHPLMNKAVYLYFTPEGGASC